MKTVYVVRGSEDGNLGVFTTREKAATRALFYLKRLGPPFIQVSDRAFNPSWTKLPADLKSIAQRLKENNGICLIEVDNEKTTALIEAFPLNQQ